ncbi:uncharacterized protein LAJ45_00264 [Morchella importuna]|uniref:DNA polymerase delta subunit 3 n=1 Tax=Morchella conica CCBAS932 TaxID=1392247 RepID=A0A3N4KQR3_9PEZI|nr:uncharacterized protein LAJ45_00264 [Morchella importuna]KAH8155255.1 hypothetical protein LAJ45_00264 [Morchella importuna]RPB11769.1 hypothetical protein P167DRAFT_565640 [Morchella conica CCBAS932]
MNEYRDYLKDAIIVQKTVVSYRVLSRALKVHVNQAKEMLFDFYTSENATKPKSIHATYIVTGYRKPQPPASAGGRGSAGDDNDTVMFDSSFPGTQTTVTTGEVKKGLCKVVELCQEEELEAVKAELEKVLSVHLYSLEQVRLEDFTILTGCSAKVLAIHQNEDPLELGATYGIILNTSAKRTGNRALPSVPEPARKATISVGQEKKKLPTKKDQVAVKREAAAKKKEAKSETRDDPEVKAETKEKKPIAKTSTLPSTKTASAAAKAKRGQSNDIFSSWKAAPKKKTTDPVSETSSAAQSPRVEEESSKEDIGDDDDELNNEKSQSPAHDDTEYTRKRKEKDEELRNMMDDDDEGDIKMEDDEEPPVKMAKIENQAGSPDIPTGAVAGVVTSGGRVRGKRKVLKKIQSRDSDGYLATKTEHVWESFSEDEPEPPKPKPVVKPVAKGKKNKDNQSKGQGNLMSYFAKK